MNVVSIIHYMKLTEDGRLSILVSLKQLHCSSKYLNILSLYCVDCETIQNHFFLKQSFIQRGERRHSSFFTVSERLTTFVLFIDLFRERSNPLCGSIVDTNLFQKNAVFFKIKIALIIKEVALSKSIITQCFKLLIKL